MAERSKEECEKIFDELSNSFNEYSTENITIDHEPVKSQILELLKTRRPVKLTDYEYGLSHALKKDHHLIVKEEQNTSKIKFGVLFASIQHHKGCKSKPHSIAIQIQKLLQDGKQKEALSLAQSSGKKNQSSRRTACITSFLNGTSETPDENDELEPLFVDATSAENSMLLPNPESEPNLPSNILAEDNGARSDTSVSIPTSTNLKRRITYNVEEEDDENGVLVNFKRPKVESAENLMEEVEEENDDIDQKPEINQISMNEHFDAPFPFEIPSSKMLKEICKKLNVQYSNEAYKLWSKIQFEQLLTTSPNIKSHNFKSKNIFECFSLLFTGSNEQYFEIQHSINEAFRQELVNAGKMAQHKIDAFFMKCTVSNELFIFITKFLNCRIVIFQESNMNRFGKWDSKSDDILTIILSHFNGLYSIVLDL